MARHWAWADDLHSRYSARAACGVWVRTGDIASRRELVTCERCQQELVRFDRLACSLADEPERRP